MSVTVRPVIVMINFSRASCARGSREFLAGRQTPRSGDILRSKTSDIESQQAIEGISFPDFGYSFCAIGFGQGSEVSEASPSGFGR